MKFHTFANGKHPQPTEHWEDRLLEVFDALWDDLVDPREAYADSTGDWWLPVGAANGSARSGERAGNRTIASPTANSMPLFGSEQRVCHQRT